MQKGNGPQSPDPYLTWQDLVDDETPRDKPSAEDQLGSVDDVALDTSDDIKLPPELEALLAKKERLEEELKRLTGQGEPDAEDERYKRMYPVKVHTKESRIEERRLRRHDERQRLLKQRALEAKRSRDRLRQRKAELEAERLRKANEKARIEARWEANRKKVVLRRALADRQQRRQEERQAESQRKQVEKELIQTHWETNRRVALLRRAQLRRQQALWLEQVMARQRKQATQEALAQKKKHQEQGEKERVRQARMLEQYRQAKAQQKLEQRQQGKKQEARFGVERERRTEIPHERSVDESQILALQYLRQRKQATLELEQRFEAMRQRALQRRQENKAVEAHFDRRNSKHDRFS